jgi:hypothetical protein
LHVAWGACWVAVYLVLVLAPLFVLLVGPRPTGGGFWWDLSIALGFAATSMMSVQFVLTARFKRATSPYGIDVIYSIAGVGNRRSPLDDVGDRLSAEDVRKWIVEPQTMKPGVTKRAYDKLPPGELDALVASVMSLTRK